MREIKKKVLKYMLPAVPIAMIFATSIPSIAANSSPQEIRFKIQENDFKSEINGGFYNSVKIDASPVYKKGVEDGKKNADVTLKVNNIKVNPGEQGMFAADKSSKEKTFTEENMSDFTLDVQPKTSWFKFSRWDITFENSNLVYNAIWGAASKIFESNTDVVVEQSGIYRVSVHGGNGSQYGGSGAIITANFHLTKGDTVRYYINQAKSGGAGGYSAIFYKKADDTEFYPLLVAGGGANGYHIGGGVDGNGNGLDFRLDNGSKRDYIGESSTALDNSPYSPNSMTPSGYGPKQDYTWHDLPGAFYTDTEDFYGGSGWRGGKNGRYRHWEGNGSDGNYAGMNTIEYYSTAGTSHIITKSEIDKWGFTDVCKPIILDDYKQNGENANIVFQGGKSSGAKGTLSLVSED